jgi:heptosyltransferase-2
MGEAASPDRLDGSFLTPRRILVRGVNWLGDAVMTTPALRRLREKFPGLQITLLHHEKLADLWRNHPSIDATISFAAGENPWSVARRLRPNGFDIAVLLPNSPRSALEAWLARIPQRIGYARAWRNLLLTQQVATRTGYVPMRKLSVRAVNQQIRKSGLATLPPRAASFAAHHVHQYLHLVATLGANPDPVQPELAVQAEELETVAAKFNLANERNQGRPLLGLNPGAEYGPAKRWPVDRFVAAAREIQMRTGGLWLLFGGAADTPMAQQLAASFGNPDSGLRNLTGKTSLRELMGLLKLCRVLLTNDSGPMHVAAALGIPVVVPFGSTSGALTGPGLAGDVHHQLLSSHAACAPCFRRTCPIDFRCMNGISVESVVTAALQVLESHGA